MVEAREYLKPDQGGLLWPPLTQGVLLKRYKRFLVDVRLRNGHIITAHCPNTGSMKTCSEPGRPVYLSLHKNPNRKYKHTWEIIDMPTSLVGVNTMVPNKLVKEAVTRGKIKGLEEYGRVRSEVPVNRHSRLDLLLEKDNGERCYIEIKNTTLVQEGAAYFPDAVTTRGRKHLEELARLVNKGHRAIILFLIQRTDAVSFSPADHLDPDYGRTLRKVAKEGVEILPCDVSLDLDRIDLNRTVPVTL
jgi:sugar fermentation stimulation protein A